MPFIALRIAALTAVVVVAGALILYHHIREGEQQQQTHNWNEAKVLFENESSDEEEEEDIIQEENAQSDVRRRRRYSETLSDISKEGSWDVVSSRASATSFEDIQSRVSEVSVVSDEVSVAEAYEQHNHFE